MNWWRDRLFSRWMKCQGLGFRLPGLTNCRVVWPVSPHEGFPTLEFCCVCLFVFHLSWRCIRWVFIHVQIHFIEMQWHAGLGTWSPWQKLTGDYRSNVQHESFEASFFSSFKHRGATKVGVNNLPQLSLLNCKERRKSNYHIQFYAGQLNMLTHFYLEFVSQDKVIAKVRWNCFQVLTVFLW